MRKDLDDVRKRLHSRKKQRQPMRGEPRSRQSHDHMPTFTNQNVEMKIHPLFNKQSFLMRAMIAACLFLGAGILFKAESDRLVPAQDYVNDMMAEEFQFASVKEWYEGNFGNPVALFPTSPETNSNSESPVYALPASGKVLENFETTGKGIMVETVLSSGVEAIDAGVVTYAGDKEGIGQTVVLQHTDGSESWYGMLDSIDVSLYDFVQTKDQLGSVSNSEDGKTGTFYFAIKKNEAFIDPLQVVPIE
ncbi:M23 family metallopeptidase [Bacillus sp. N1-1]|jgi:stage IV sporulation protein FA|uniref:M23 family metallopeptidase n=1 Tax=Bacillus sp. N1-1 TaxID=2682541 RepID=UPI0013198857|nr:M23 family metallopeptidase [Bacillus sp. N1-1]QHA92755.1 peptidoglycan DD-metalloendopeptidase family protein [Bacillus sp. N1-1]